jgi:hypothetical protein
MKVALQWAAISVVTILAVVPTAAAQISDNVVKIGILGDLTGHGLRVKDACEDLLHVLIVPRGHFPPSLQAGF